MLGRRFNTTFLAWEGDQNGVPWEGARLLPRRVHDSVAHQRPEAISHRFVHPRPLRLVRDRPETSPFRVGSEGAGADPRHECARFGGGLGQGARGIFEYLLQREIPY